MTHLLRFLRFLPRNIVVAMLRVYRAVISPLYGDVCRYYPSCSGYALGSVQQHGAVRGSTLAILRIARCHPWAAGGVDDVRPSRRSLSTNSLGFVTGFVPVVTPTPAPRSAAPLLRPQPQKELITP